MSTTGHKLIHCTLYNVIVSSQDKEMMNHLLLPKCHVHFRSCLILKQTKKKGCHSHNSFCIISILWHKGAGYVQQWNGICLREADLYYLIQHLFCHMLFQVVCFHQYFEQQQKDRKWNMNTEYRCVNYHKRLFAAKMSFHPNWMLYI